MRLIIISLIFVYFVLGIDFEDADKQVFHLETHNFKALTSKDSWAIFYGAKWCSHCKAYTPVWLEFEKAASNFTNKLRVAKVECTTNADLCQDIKGYPTVNFINNGVKVEEYGGLFNLSETIKYFEKKAKDFSPVIDSKNNTDSNSTILKADEKFIGTSNEENQTALIFSEDSMKALRNIIEAKREPNNDINPNAEVVHLTDESFEAMTADSVWFIMFHAPWCGHCKQLSPIWEQMAISLKGYVNVGKVDCTAQKQIAKKFGVDRYPSLKFIIPKMEPVDYLGNRQLAFMERSALEMVSAPFFTPIHPNEIKDIMEKNEVSFFLIYNPLTMAKSSIEVFEPAARQYLSRAKFFVIPDLNEIEELHVQSSKNSSVATLLVSKEFGKIIKQYSGEMRSYKDDAPLVSKWIGENYKELVPQLDSSNQKEIFTERELVIMAIVDPEDLSAFEKTMNCMRQSVKLSDSKRNHGNISYIWLDGMKWQSYVSRVYKIEPKDYPRIVLANPIDSEYFDVDKNGESFILDAVKLNDYISDALDGKIKAKSQAGFIAVFAKYVKNTWTSIRKVLYGYPIISLAVLLAWIVGAWIYIARVVRGYEKIETTDKTD